MWYVAVQALQIMHNNVLQLTAGCISFSSSLWQCALQLEAGWPPQQAHASHMRLAGGRAHHCNAIVFAQALCWPCLNLTRLAMA
jgi:hypothetical protein